MKYISDIIRKLKCSRYRKYNVVLDGRANSVTISRSLYRHIMRKERTDVGVIVFKSRDSGLYCFAMREDFAALMKADTYFAQLQYNEQFRKIGFRSDHPSVTAICGEYGCPLDRMVRLSVIPRKTADGICFYEIQKPKL